MLSWFSLLTTASVAVVAVRAQTPSCPALTNPYIGDYDGTAFNLCCEVSQTPVNNDGASSCAVTAYDAATNAVTYACAYTSTASTGADFVFPSGVASLGLTVSGQPGGSSATSGYGSRQGGSGATLAGSLTTADYAFTGTTAGTFTGTVYVNVGGGLTESEGFESGGGYSSFGYSSTGTSGATLAPGTAADPRIVTAGGGGGVSETPGGDGGSAGPAGGSGIDGESTNTPPNGGLGGSQTAPGTGQGGFAAGVSGSGPSGGAGRYGGGGGGGYFGGAGGGSDTDGSYYDYGGGGGGSSHAVGSFVATSTDNDGAAGVLISYTVTCSAPIEPTAAARRRMARSIAMKQRYLAAYPDCPDTQRACPLPSGNFECIEYDELSSCGGCVADGSGVDCLAIPGVNGVTCLNDECVAISCLPGFTRRGDKCV